MKGFYPEETQGFSLAMHMGLPEGKRPVFFARFLTRRTRRAMAEKLKASWAADDAGDEAEAEKLMGEALAMLIARGENLPEGFDIAEIGDHLDHEECVELHEAALKAIAVTKDELKKSGSPSGSDSDTSAKNAGGDPRK